MKKTVVILILAGTLMPVFAQEREGHGESVSSAEISSSAVSREAVRASRSQTWLGLDLSFFGGLDWQNETPGLNPLFLYDDTCAFMAHSRQYIAIAPSEHYRSELSLLIDFQVRFSDFMHESVDYNENELFPYSEISPGREFPFSLGIIPVSRIGFAWDNIIRPADNWFVTLGLEYLFHVNLVFYAHRIGGRVSVGNSGLEGFRWLLKEEAYADMSSGLLMPSWGEWSSRTTLYGEYDMLRLAKEPQKDYTLRLFSDFYFACTNVIRTTDAYEFYDYRFSDLYLSETFGLKSDVTKWAEFLLAGSYWFRNSTYYSENHVFGFKTGVAVYFDGGIPSLWYRSRVDGKEAPRNRYALRAYYWGGYNPSGSEWDSVLQILFDIRLGGEPRNPGTERTVGSDPSFPPLPEH